MSTLRTIQDRHGAIKRQLRSLGESIGYSDPDDLAYLVAIQDQAGELLGQAVCAQRTMGYNDTQIGEALGVTRAAVSKRWPGDGSYVGAAGRYRKSPTQEAAQ